MKFTTVIIKENIINRKIYLILFPLTILLYIFYKIKYNHNQIIFIICAISWVFMLVLSIIDKLKEKVIKTGEIEFEDELILIYNLNKLVLYTYNIKEVDEIVLTYKAFKGELEDSFGYFYTDNIPSKGGNNEIKIKTKDKGYKYNIYLDSETDAIRLRMLYRFLKENNVNVKLKEP